MVFFLFSPLLNLKIYTDFDVSKHAHGFFLFLFNLELYTDFNLELNTDFLDKCPGTIFFFEKSVP